MRRILMYSYHVISRYVYRLWLYDTGGDGWQGATYAIRNSSVLLDLSEPGSVIVASGTLGSGFEDAHWMCLADGCYELSVGGGSADSEIEFRFVDEVGDHFQASRRQCTAASFTREMVFACLTVQ